MMRIKALNELINTVAANTLRESEGKRGDVSREKAKVKQVLSYILQRTPKKEEVEMALSPIWIEKL